MWRVRVSIGVLFSLVCLPGVVSWGESFSLYTHEIEFAVDGRAAPYRLPHAFLLLGREEVWVEGMKLGRGEDYDIDYTKGEISFNRKIEAGSRVKVSYWFFPFSLERSYQKELPAPSRRSEAAERGAPRQSRETASEEERGELSIFGSRSLGVSFGSQQDPSFDQSLRVRLNGSLSRDVFLKAALSDEASPLLAEGTTERLSEVDKVFVQVSGSSWDATLGDCDLSLPESDFGQVERKLEGAVLRGESYWGQISLAGARAEGEFASLRFQGVEGKQGPYGLRPEGEEGDVVVVPGSERVYLDGEFLTRGENNDYTIDYSTAEITFAHRRLVTRDSRILVDFEYSTNSYRRNLFSSSTHFHVSNGSFKVGGMAFREGDERDSPLGFDLTPERREILAGAGDDTSVVWVDGAIRVGEGEGSYVLQDSIYEYVGYRRGDYQVNFTRAEGGDYEFDPGLGGYRWVGAGGGGYIPKVRIPLPAELTLLDLSAEGEVLAGVMIKAEYAGSLEDRNTFSPGTGEWGTGSKVSLSVNRWERLSLKASSSLLEEGFRFPGRFHAAEYEDRWGSKPLGRERQREIEGRLTPLPYLAVEADYGELLREGGRSVSNGVGGRLGRGFPYLAFGYEGLTTSESDSVCKSRRKISGEHRFGRIQPGVSFSQETLTSSADTGRSYSQVQGGIKLVGALSAHVSSQFRKDKVLRGAGGWVYESNTTTEQLGLTIPKWRGASVSLDLSHRERRFGREVPGEDMVYDLVSLKGSWDASSGFLRSETAYDISNEERTLKEEQFYEVGEGEGDYSKDPSTGAYYPDENGSYRRVVVPVGDPQPITRLSAFIRTQLSPIPLLSFECIGSVSEETREREKRAIYLLDLSKFQKDETTIFGKNSLEAEVQLYPQDGLVIRGAWRKAKEADNRINLRHVRRGSDGSTLHVKTNLTPRVGLDLEAYREREVQSSTERGEEKGERGMGGSSTASFRPVRSVELSLGMGGERRTIWEPYYYPSLGDVLVDKGEVFPRFLYAMSGAGRIELAGKLSQRRIPLSPDGLPPDIALLHPPGLTIEWDLGLSYQLNRYLTSSLSYRGEKRADREATHSGQAEMRAYF